MGRPYVRNEYEVILSPGDELPSGVYVTGWKLREDAYGLNKLCLHYIPSNLKACDKVQPQEAASPGRQVEGKKVDDDIKQNPAY